MNLKKKNTHAFIINTTVLHIKRRFVKLDAEFKEILLRTTNGWKGLHNIPSGLVISPKFT